MQNGPSPQAVFGVSGIYGFISQQGVQNLGVYKYNGVDQSFLANLIMKHWWNWLIDNVVPPTIAPNVLTLMGFFCVLAANLVLWAYSPLMDRAAPNWTYVFAALMIFCYQTLDNLDGKQARKTGSSSALGEVFDHGADSLTVSMFVMIMTTAFQFSHIMSFIALIMLGLIFYFAHWENFFTGSLILRKWSNPTEAQLFLISNLLITSYFGAEWWKEPVNTVIFGYIQKNQILFFFTVIGFLTTSYDHISTTYAVVLQRGNSLKTPAFAMFPILFVFLIASIWAILAPSLLTENPRIFITTIGLLFSYLAIRIIVQNVTKEPFRLYYNIQTPLLLITFHSLIGQLFVPLLDDNFILWCYFLVVFLHVSFLCVSLVWEFSVYLNIHPFDITKKPALDALV
jgi:ethanolaminephosphotransferase